MTGMMGGGTTEQIRGRVEQANEKGLKVDGRWFNWSRFSNSSVRPSEGDDVELEIARGKFINDARIVGEGGQGSLSSLNPDDDPFAAPPEASPRATRSAPAASTSPASGPPRASAATATPNADRNTEIRRLALIKAAADYAAARSMDPEEVVTLAAQWEEWVVERS